MRSALQLAGPRGAGHSWPRAARPWCAAWHPGAGPGPGGRGCSCCSRWCPHCWPAGHGTACRAAAARPAPGAGQAKPTNGDRPGGEHLAAAHQRAAGRDITRTPSAAGRGSSWKRSSPGATGKLSYADPYRNRGKFTADRTGSGSPTRSGWWRSAVRSVVRGTLVGHAEKSSRWPRGDRGEPAGSARATADADDIGHREDDAAPRLYKTATGCAGCHWKSTARYGQLMVAARNTSGATARSSFSSIPAGPAHSAADPPRHSSSPSARPARSRAPVRRGLPTRLITDAGEIARARTFGRHPARHARGDQPVP